MVLHIFCILQEILNRTFILSRHVYWASDWDFFQEISNSLILSIFCLATLYWANLLFHCLNQSLNLVIHWHEWFYVLCHVPEDSQVEKLQLQCKKKNGNLDTSRKEFGYDRGKEKKTNHDEKFQGILF